MAEEKQETLAPQQEQEIKDTLIIKEKSATPYKVTNSNFYFDVKFDDNGQYEISGQIRTASFIADTELDFIRTWKFHLKDIIITKIHADNHAEDLLYDFTAKDFEVYTGDGEIE